MKTIAILGGGFGGIRTALLLGRQIKNRKLADQYRVVLIDQNEYHTYTPTLYEAATSSVDPIGYAMMRELITVPIVKILSGLPVEFMKATITQIDARRHTVHLARNSTVLFDYVVIALGSQSHFYDIPGLEKCSLSLKTFKDAIAIRMQVAAFAKMERGEVRVLIGGAGSTGVETAGEIKMWLDHLQHELPYKLTHEVCLIEASPDVLPGFDPRVVKKVHKRLERIGVRVAANERIESLNEHFVTLHSGKTIHHDLFIWTGGIKPNSLVSRAGLLIDHTGRLTVNAEMECSFADSGVNLDSHIYGLGDNVTVMNPKTGKPVPSVASAALTEATVIAHNIMEEITVAEKTKKTAPKLQRYEPREFPYVIPVGGKYAVAKMGSVIMFGFVAWVVKVLIEFKYLISIMPFFAATKLWFKEVKFFFNNESHR